MKPAALLFAFLVAILSVSASSARAAAEPQKTDAAAPADRVVVMYFHRTVRCATCQKMGSYSEEAVVKGFGPQIADRTVEFHYIDFQDPKNAALTKGYKITGPTLVVVKVVDNKAVEVRNLQDIWTKHTDKAQFLQYVRDNIRACLKPAAATASSPKSDTSAAKAQ